jgi:hypothetical protein
MPVLIGDTTGPLSAQGIVNEAWDYYRNLGDQWINLTTQAITDLTAIQIQPINFNVRFDVDSYLPTFSRPTRPTTPTVAPIAAESVPAPDLDTIVVRAVGDAPEEPDFSNFPTYAPPIRPSTPLPTPPVDVDPDLEAIVVADRPDYVLPAVPTLQDLDLPTFDAITLPTFAGVRPTFDIAMPDDGQLDWQAIEYTSDLKDEVVAKLRSMVQGETGLPLAIEQAIFDRARAREDRLSRQQIMEVSEDLASRNLSEPNGLLAARLKQVRADNREKKAALNRDLAIDTANKALEGIKFAVGQGIALEQVLIQQNEAINERALRAALATRDYGIARVNTLIAYQNLQQQAYATDAQVHRDLIAAALAPLEVFRAEIEAQRLVGEFNRDREAQYEAQLRGVQALADFYRNDVEAAKARSELNNQRIAAAKLVLERYDTQVTAWGKLQDGYKTQVDAAIGSIRFSESLANIFASRMQGYKLKGEAYFNEGRFQIERNNQTIERFRAALQGSDQDLRAQVAALDAQLRLFGGEVALYGADGQIVQAESAALDRRAEILTAIETGRTQTELKAAEIRVQQALKIGEIYVEQLKGKMAALAQLAASSQSGVNFGASLSGSLSTSFSYGKSFGYSGETPDATPTQF